MDNLIIQLDNPITVNHGGSFVDVSILQVEQCSMLHFNLYADVKEVVTKSLFTLKDMLGDNEKGGDSTSSTDDSNDEIGTLPIDIFAGAGTLKDLQKVINKYLLINAVWDDDIKVLETHLNKLGVSEYKRILEGVSYFLYTD